MVATTVGPSPRSVPRPADRLGARRDHTLDAAVPGLASSATRAKMLCLRCYTEAKTARRANAVWSHLCLGCHYHQYEISPTRSQVRAWRDEVGELVQALTI